MPESNEPQPMLDHIVILVSEKCLLTLPDKLKDTLVVAEGGDHADGLTTNRLILFQDGVYLELIAFFDDVPLKQRKSHRWGHLKEGTVIDWACSLPDESDFKPIQQRVSAAHTGYTYHDPVPGGRTKPDGTVLEWAVASAIDADGNATWPGHLPFWCLDRTPRERRVPYVGNEKQTRHPCGVRGVSRVVVAVPTRELTSFGKVYDAVYEASGHSGWRFLVPSGSEAGKRVVSLTASDEAPAIKLVMKGGPESPRIVELFPGLELLIES